MENNIENLSVYEQVTRKYGTVAQLGVAQEECAELIVAISKFLRSRGVESINNMAEETADVQIMVEQIRTIIGDDLVREHYDRKVKRLFQKVNQSVDSPIPNASH